MGKKSQSFTISFGPGGAPKLSGRNMSPEDAAGALAFGIAVRDQAMAKVEAKTKPAPFVKPKTFWRIHPTFTLMQSDNFRKPLCQENEGKSWFRTRLQALMVLQQRMVDDVNKVRALIDEEAKAEAKRTEQNKGSTS